MNTWVAGVDGCPGGWLAVLRKLDDPRAAIVRFHSHFADILTMRAANELLPPVVIAVDIPIGLPDKGSIGGRLADREARSVLGRRQSAVFAVPARRAVMCTDYREACATAQANSNPSRKVSKQTFNLFPKIREVDALISPTLQDRVFEVHPEAAFWALNGETPLSEPKKVKSQAFKPGLNQRKKLLETAGYDPAFLKTTIAPRRIAGPDDFLDACANSWSAARIARGEDKCFPEKEERDSKGLRMEIRC